jgi:Tfp pilus assembly protein PilN
MIKINLLRDPLVQSAAKGRDKKKEAADSSIETKTEAKMETKTDTIRGGGKPAAAAGITLCLLFSGLGGFYYFLLCRKASVAEALNAELLEDKQELQPYLKLEAQFREQSESLRQKEDALTKLKKQQQFPVYFLQELASALPENVWFAKVASKGPAVEIKGESLTEDAIYQFRDNLAVRAQWFRNVNFVGANRRDKRLEFTMTLELVPA